MGRVYRKIAAKSIEFSSTKSVPEGNLHESQEISQFKPRKSNIEICNLDENIITDEDMKSDINLHHVERQNNSSKIGNKIITDKNLAAYDCLAKNILFAQKKTVFEKKKKKEQLEIQKVKSRMKTFKEKQSSDNIDIIEYYYRTEIQSLSRTNSRAHSEFDIKIDKAKYSLLTFANKVKSCQNLIELKINQTKQRLDYIQGLIDCGQDDSSKEEIKGDFENINNSFLFKARSKESSYNIVKEKHPNHMSFLYNFNLNNQNSNFKFESRNSHAPIHITNNILDKEDTSKATKEFGFSGQAERIDFDF